MGLKGEVMAEFQGIDSAHERENGTALWLVPIESALVVWTQEKGLSLHEGEQVWHLCKGATEHVLHPNRE